MDRINLEICGLDEDIALLQEAINSLAFRLKGLLPIPEHCDRNKRQAGGESYHPPWAEDLLAVTHQKCSEFGLSPLRSILESNRLKEMSIEHSSARDYLSRHANCSFVTDNWLYSDASRQRLDSLFREIKKMVSLGSWEAEEMTEGLSRVYRAWSTEHKDTPAIPQPPTDVLLAYLSSTDDFRVCTNRISWSGPPLDWRRTLNKTERRIVSALLPYRTKAIPTKKLLKLACSSEHKELTVSQRLYRCPLVKSEHRGLWSLRPTSFIENGQLEEIAARLQDRESTS